MSIVFIGSFILFPKILANSSSIALFILSILSFTEGSTLTDDNKLLSEYQMTYFTGSVKRYEAKAS